ncbi:MAG TPA: HsdR family type I site-specific deoxyribonuclease, partial [Gammaproteobacteria bacterium]|nr:HsdR family type I site-specific deoxyribonuclease [Gammaproteobacteria bacterium]
MKKISENEIEDFAIELFEKLGYEYVYAPSIAPDSDTPERERFEDVVLIERLRAAVGRINPAIPADAREEAIKQILRLNSPELINNNENFHRMLTEGIKVSVQEKGQERGNLVWLIDFTHPENNEFLIANQFTVIENHQNKRPDVILFVNGLPLVVIELKNAADENATIGSAWKQLQTYKDVIPGLFAYNSVLIISDGLEAKAGSLSAGLSRFMAWKTADGKLEASPLISQLETLINGMLNKATLLDLVRHFIVFERKTVQTQPALSPSQREGNNYRGNLNFVGLIKQVKELCRNQTQAEKIFWELARNKQFGGLKFRRQHQIGHYIVDFYCHSEKLVIEFDGKIHGIPEQRKKDSKRDKYLTSLGNKVIRFENNALLDNPQAVFKEIAKSLSPAGRDGREGGITTVTTIKKLAAYHQYYAVNAAVASTLRAASATEGLPTSETPENYGVASVKSQPKGDQKAGVVWHTQGSGKSLSMVFYTGKIVLALDNPTIVMITDRNDLDDQLFDTFAACTQVLRQEPRQIEDRQQLKALLKVASGGVIFTTIQKFQPEEGNVYEKLTNRRNVVVIADEAHRTQYGFKAKTVDEKDAQGNVTGKKIVYGFAKYLRDALPNATYLGFTGTPIESTDVNTPAVFGNYIDVYDIAQAVEDGATKRIYYESRLAKVTLSDEGKKLIAELDDELEQDELSETQKAKAKWTQMEALVGAEQRINNVTKDIVAHFDTRQEVFMGKGMIVAMSRRIAADLYDEIVKIKPDWHSDNLTKGAIKVVMTAASSDGPKMAKHHTTKQQRKALAERMKDPDDELKLVIVRDMWLTGFDAPCMHTLYIDKPMKGHNLMQAIARVNRVYGDKPAGLVVDYLGIASDLKQALSFYSDAGGKGDPMLAQEQAVKLLLEKIEVVADMFHRFPYENYFQADTSKKLAMILAAEEHILGLENGKKRYIDEVTALSQTFAIAIPHEQAMDVKDEIAFFQAVKARLAKFDSTGSGRTNEEIETTIRQVIDKALVSEQVVDVFDAAGIKKPDISILSEEFLLELKNKEHKNIALEVLKKLLNDEIKARYKKNLVQSRSLMEMLQTAIKRYHAKVLTAAEVMDELINISKEIIKSDKQAEEL